MKINLIEAHEKTYTSEDIDLSPLDPEILEIPSRVPTFRDRKEMPGRITRIYLRQKLNLVNPGYSSQLLICVETTRLKKNGEPSAIKPETHRFTRKSVEWAHPYWAEKGYTFDPIVEALSEQIDELDKATSEQ